jgi:hypothetical protein
MFCVPRDYTMLDVLCVSSNDRTHDSSQCNICISAKNGKLHMGLYECSRCHIKFSGKRLGAKHVAVCKLHETRTSSARTVRKRNREICDETRVRWGRRREKYNKEMQKHEFKRNQSVRIEKCTIPQSATDGHRVVPQVVKLCLRSGITEYHAAVLQSGADGHRVVPQVVKLCLRSGITEYHAALDEELDRLIGRVCRVREAARRGVRGPMIGYIVSALSPRVINVEILTLQAAKVGPYCRQGFHRHGRKMVNVAIHDITIIDADNTTETETHIDLAAALLFDLSVKQQVWRGFDAFCEVCVCVSYSLLLNCTCMQISPVLFRCTLRNLSRLQNADAQRLVWKDDAPRQSLHPDRCTRYAMRLLHAGWIDTEMYDILMRFVTEAFVRVCNTL